MARQATVTQPTREIARKAFMARNGEPGVWRTARQRALTKISDEVAVPPTYSASVKNCVVLAALLLLAPGCGKKADPGRPSTSTSTRTSTSTMPAPPPAAPSAPPEADAVSQASPAYDAGAPPPV